MQIVGDGAEWIANIVRDAFPASTLIFTNDFYHACEYLHGFINLAESRSEIVKTTYRRAKSILYRFGGAALFKHIKKTLHRAGGQPSGLGETPLYRETC